MTDRALGLVNPDGSITVKKRPFCWPENFEIDEKARVVTCTKCKRVVDPIDCLIQLSRLWEPYRESAAHAKRMAQQANEELEDLKRQIRNARATLGRLGKQQ